mgnify:CR=1 FL=1
MTGVPNLLYILLDDLGYGDVSCLNPSCGFPTPGMDRIGREGMVFTDAHSSSAVCTPSRYSVLTGRYCWRTRLKSHVTRGYAPPLIEPGRMTVASLLREHGYRTGCFGKWHLGWNWPVRPGAAADLSDRTDPDAELIDWSSPVLGGPVDCGFERFVGISASLDMPPYVWVNGREVEAAPDGSVEAEQGQRFWRAGPIAPGFDHAGVAGRIIDETASFIRRSVGEGRPFFAYCAHTGPHTPILPSAAWRGRSGLNDYADLVLEIDSQVGHLLGLLDELGVAGETIVVLASDNGCSSAADFPALLARGHNPSHVFRGHKADIYEGGHRVPLLVRWPQRIAPGGVCGQTVCLSDLLATMAEVVQSPLPEEAGEDSVSHWPLWIGGGSGPAVRDFTLHHSIDGSFSVRAGPWKLEMCPGSGGWSWPRPGPECEGLPPIQLYHLETDIAEKHNVQADHPEVVERLTAMLTRAVLDGRTRAGSARADAQELWRQLWWMQPPASRA